MKVSEFIELLKLYNPEEEIFLLSEGMLFPVVEVVPAEMNDDAKPVVAIRIKD